MLARIRKSTAEKDRGFTLIELLVVMIIIGILAAIAIPVFLNQRKRAVDSSIKSDLRSIANQLETYYTDNQAYVLPTQASTGGDVTIGSGSTAETVKVSGTNLYTFRLLTNATTSTSSTTAATGYCISGSGNGKGSGATITYNSLTGGIGSTACPGAPAP